MMTQFKLRFFVFWLSYPWGHGSTSYKNLCSLSTWDKTASDPENGASPSTCALCFTTISTTWSLEHIKTFFLCSCHGLRECTTAPFQDLMNRVIRCFSVFCGASPSVWVFVVELIFFLLYLLSLKVQYLQDGTQLGNKVTRWLKFWWVWNSVWKPRCRLKWSSSNDCWSPYWLHSDGTPVCNSPLNIPFHEVWGCILFLESREHKIFQSHFCADISWWPIFP